MTQISLFSGSAASSSHHAGRNFAHQVQSSGNSVAGRLGGLVIALQEWQERYRSRRDLVRMSEHQLKDIGLSRFDAEEEYRKPFWRG